ncbi:MAG: tetratricopeptide repeat protein [Prevotella sp.]|nr:tetratricopeptide repeat protein [Prevotella sp.]
MNLIELIEHPELLDKDTLYQLRQLTASHPYYQTARLLLLQNLYLLHESSFDDELQRAALYITDRTKLFDMIEARHYQLTSEKSDEKKPSGESDRTTTLIDNFLDHQDEEAPRRPKRRRPTATDATVDYVAYLLESDESDEGSDTPGTTPEMQGQSLIDKFINEEGGKMTLQEKPEYAAPPSAEEQKNGEEGYFTATLARIYVKQGRYSKALEIIKRLNLNYPKKSAYFADQIRFLEKLIINNKKNS